MAPTPLINLETTRLKLVSFLLRLRCRLVKLSSQRLCCWFNYSLDHLVDKGNPLYAKRMWPNSYKHLDFTYYLAHISAFSYRTLATVSIWPSVAQQSLKGGKQLAIAVHKPFVDGMPRGSCNEEEFVS
jgi:hypothetical protein